MSDEVQRSLGRIEGSLDEVKNLIERHLTEDDARFSSVNNRLGSVEKKTYAASTIISLVGAYITTKLLGH